MYPEIDIGRFTFSSYSVLYLLAFLLAVSVFWIELRRRKENFRLFLLFSLTLLLTGFAGAKIFYMALNVSLRDFIREPVETILAPGKIYHGGFILSILAALILVRLTKKNFWVMADSVAPALALSIAVGRIGCFLNGCCLGKPTSLPWGVSFAGAGLPEDLKLHPAQLYESMLMAGLFLFLWKMTRKNYPEGFVLSIYLLVWGFERFFIEFLRINARTPFLSLSVAQIISLGIVLFAGCNFFRLKRLKKVKADRRDIV